jgi:hypothetical protein
LRRAEIPEVDTEIVILYDPDEPGKAVIYPSRMLKVDAP